MTSWYESHIDRQIREAQERGEFDGLPGAGRPLPDHGELYDEDWWIRDLARRERLPGGIPPTLRLRREVEDLPQELVKFKTEDSLRRAIADLNVRIERAKRGLIEGPSTILPALDADEVVDAWRRARAE
ncbi:DnaJ family domain-containing protein [Dactylosporangium darangshiense]|uniref:DUF1992 domain-containing protein n=1 Tax=Dactylosporangium darangshiense TaxID=579108 RepID=A0ABP8DS19_9ACTN